MRAGLQLREREQMPVMLVVIWISARFVLHRFRLPSASLGLLLTGLWALCLLLGAELLLAVALADRSLAQYIASRDPVSGSVYLGMLAVFAAMPLLHARAAARLPGSALTEGSMAQRPPGQASH